MIYGIGCDICDLRRMAAALDRRGERLAERVLGEEELRVFRSRRARVEARGISYLGTRFSAKEAFSKAIGLGLHSPMRWRDCQILNLPSGQPHIQLQGDLADWFASRRLRAHVSLTDETDYATSYVVVETLP